MVKGFDISHNNTVNWNKLPTDVKFVFIKASQGVSFHDPAFQSNWKIAKSIGLIVGTYEFWDAQADPQKQADNFLNRGVDWSMPGVLPPVIDIENQVGSNNAASAQLDKYILNNKDKCRNSSLQLLEIVKNETKRKPIVYCSPHFLQEYLGDSRPFAEYDLWIAGYQPAVPHLPAGFADWLFWQYSQYGQLNGALTGGEFDLDYFNGSASDLKLLANIKT